MSEIGPGILLVRGISEGEARAGKFEAIHPVHVWMALTKLAELPEEAVSKLVEAPDQVIASLQAEIRRLRQWFASEGLDSTRLRRALRSSVGTGKGSGESLHRSSESVALFDAAKKLAAEGGHSTLEPVHLARALVVNPPPALAELLAREGRVNPAVPSPIAEATPGEKADGLARFGRDLTAQAAAGKLDPLVGRREELLRLAQILTRKRKRNAMLVGEAGVGKTCIVEGLALKIVSPECPPAFRGKRVVELSMAALLAGTKYRGEFEERIEGIVREAEEQPDLVLFIDEFQTVMGKGGGGGLDAANILKPALARGRAQMIGATTTEEYEAHLAKDEAFARRFELVWIDEISRADALQILERSKGGLEEHHSLSIAQEALEAAVDLSIRYLPDRRLPDKALDLLDQACARRGLGSLSFRPDGGVAATRAFSGQPATVGRMDIAHVLSQRVRVPIDLLAANDRDRLAMLDDHLAGRVIGQAAAMRTVAEALRAAYRGLKDPRRPVASFLFAGPTGVGKTETAKALAEFLFGNEESLIRIDLSEYSEKHQVARLLGSPPGYVGSDEPGKLTVALRRQPASVVLFDEIEKAHPDVLNVLLQILDEGHLTDSKERKVWFREAVVILTTNIMPATPAKRLGFGASGPTAQSSESENLAAALQEHLRPELLGRLHNIVLFDPLDRAALQAIAEKIFAAFARRLEATGTRLPDDLRAEIVAKVEPGRYGAREIERLVEARVAGWLRERDERPAGYSAGEILFTVLAATLHRQEVALLVIDLEQSRQFVVRAGNTAFREVIAGIHKALRAHDSASDLFFLKCIGDGFLGLYRAAPAAFAAASGLLTGFVPGVAFRMALHWGAVEPGPKGDFLGAEVHRVFRVEGVTEDDRSEPADDASELPESGRILATETALERLDGSTRALFRPAGAFLLKGFDEPCRVWVMMAPERT